jgi:hypothetical protein
MLGRELNDNSASQAGIHERRKDRVGPKILAKGQLGRSVFFRMVLSGKWLEAEIGEGGPPNS